MITKPFILAVLMAAPLLPAPGAAQTPQVMVLGSYHMANPGRDMVNARADDVLQPRRQNEINELVTRLAAFRPTKIALEIPTDRDSLLNAQYSAYVAGRHELSRSEAQQVGFRLAARLGHARVYAVDFQKPEPIPELLRYAEQHGQMAPLAAVQERVVAMVKEWERRQAEQTITDVLFEANSPRADSMEAGYLVMASVGQGAEYPGADLVAGHYERNLKIYANVLRIAQPGDRILVIYGAGHGKLLRQYFSESPLIENVSVLPYLAPKASAPAPVK